jgi:hypothetical protein
MSFFLLARRNSDTLESHNYYYFERFHNFEIIFPQGVEEQSKTPVTMSPTHTQGACFLGLIIGCDFLKFLLNKNFSKK